MKKLEKEDITAFQKVKDTAMVWKDKKGVSLLSLVYTIKMVEVQTKSVTKRRLVYCWL